MTRQDQICFYLRSSKSPRAEDDHLASLDYGLEDLRVVCAVTRGDVGDTDSLIVSVKEDAAGARVTAEEQVVLGVHNAVNVG